MLKICSPESLHGMQIPYKICFPFSGSGSSAIQGNPKGWPHITLCRIFMYRTSLMWCTYSDHLFAIFAYTILYRQCCPFLSYISAGLHAWMNFGFFLILMFIHKIFPIPAKSPLCPCPVLVLSPWNIMFPLAAKERKQGFSWKMKKY